MGHPDSNGSQMPQLSISERFRFERPRSKRRGRARLAVALAASIALSSALPTAGHAEPGGCLKYGAVGAVGGHLAHHGVLGAAGGCAAGMYTRHKYRKAIREKAHLYDQEHPPGSGPRLSMHDKAALYDHEQQSGAAGGPPPGAQGAGSQGAGSQGAGSQGAGSQGADAQHGSF